MSKTISLIQLGLGGVGRALLRQVFATRAAQEQRGLFLRYTVLADSAGALVNENGLAESIVESAGRWKDSGGSLHEHEVGYYQHGLAPLVEIAGQPNTILIDTTGAAPAGVEPAFALARQRGYGIVLANKKPLTEDWQLWQLLQAGLLGYEATVGAGLPVIHTLRMLLDTGDEIERITGAFSGTLGYLMSELERGTAFSEAVRYARAQGWTEPDPRDDLSGMDVARKALVLARTIGWESNLSAISINPLFPEAWQSLSVDEFMARLPELDSAMAAQHNAACAAGLRLRYAATVTLDQITVGLTTVAPQTALGILRGTDNSISFYTRRYPTNPLVIQGAGAGPEVTASAMLADILRLGEMSR